MSRSSSSLRSSSRKSDPTTPTSRTGPKKEAAQAKYVAAPPSTSSAFPDGVSTES